MSPSGSKTLGSPGGRSSLTTGLVTTGDGAEATAGPSRPGGKAVTVPELGSTRTASVPREAPAWPSQLFPWAHRGSGQLPPACSGNCQHRAQSPHLPDREPSDNIMPAVGSCLLQSLPTHRHLHLNRAFGESQEHLCQEGVQLLWAGYTPGSRSTQADSLRPAGSALPCHCEVGPIVTLMSLMRIPRPRAGQDLPKVTPGSLAWPACTGLPGAPVSLV